MSRLASGFHSFSRHAVPFGVLAVAFAWASATRAQSADLPAAAHAGAIVQIAGATIRPERLSLASGQHVVFRNDSPSLARVELDLERGHGIACGSGGDAPTRGRKFVVASGAALECEAPSGPVAYRVFRTGPGAVVESSGRIEIEPGS